MEQATRTTLWNATTGLLITPDISFYATEFLHPYLYNTVRKLHTQQITIASYDRFADVVGELYSVCPGNSLTQVMICATLSRAYRHIQRWHTSAIQTAVNIHLNTIGATDDSEYPRVVPHALDDMRISRLEQIDRDLLWRILVTDPWQSYTERSRAQYARLANVISEPVTDMDIAELIAVELEKTDYDQQHRAARHSIRRAFKLHDRLFGLDDLRMLLTRGLTLTGHLYSYALHIDAGDLHFYTRKLNTGTSAIHVTVLRKIDQVPLCMLCVYFANTPLIDHLIAIKLHLKSEETELELLRLGQVQNLTNAFYHDPILPELKNLHDPATAPMTYITNLIMHANSDRHYSLLRDVFNNFDWHETATELMGYPPELLAVLKEGSTCTPWDFIDQTERAVPILEAAKRCF